MTVESLPAENSMTGLRASAVASRMMWTDSASRASRCDRPVGMGLSSLRFRVAPAILAMWGARDRRKGLGRPDDD